jgi:hypothetical protein
MVFSLPVSLLRQLSLQRRDVMVFSSFDSFRADTSAAEMPVAVATPADLMAFSFRRF